MRDELPYLPSAAAWHRLAGWCHRHAAACWTSRWWHATRNRKDHHG